MGEFIDDGESERDISSLQFVKNDKRVNLVKRLVK